MHKTGGRKRGRGAQTRRARLRKVRELVEVAYDRADLLRDEAMWDGRDTYLYNRLNDTCLQLWGTMRRMKA